MLSSTNIELTYLRGTQNHLGLLKQGRSKVLIRPHQEWEYINTSKLEIILFLYNFLVLFRSKMIYMNDLKWN